MRIRVEVKNEILGDSIFWEGDSKELNQIRNIPARELAKYVAASLDSPKKSGMWVASIVKENK